MSTHGQLLVAVMQAHIDLQADTIAMLHSEAKALCTQLRRARQRIGTLERRLSKRSKRRGRKTTRRTDALYYLPGESYLPGGILEE